MSYRIRVNLGRIDLEIEGDKGFIEEKLSDLGWLKKLLEDLEAFEKISVKVDREAELEKPSFIEYISSFEPRTNPQRFLAIAYYLYKYENRDITYEDIENYYKHARWPLPGNPRDVMSNLIREGFMEDAGKIDGKKAFRILRKGIGFIESLLRGGTS